MHPLPSERPSPYFPPPHSSRLSQGTSFGCPMSYIKRPLAICFTYGSGYASVLFFQIIPPSPCPTESKSPFIMSQCSHVRCMKTYKVDILLLDWPLYHHVMPFLVPITVLFESLFHLTRVLLSQFPFIFRIHRISFSIPSLSVYVYLYIWKVRFS